MKLSALNNKRWSSVMIAVAFVIALAAISNDIKTHAQRERPDPRADRAHERLIQKKTNSAIPNEPVAFVLVKTKKGEVQPGKAFKDEDNDWTRGFTVRAQNISQKSITYIDVTFSFERPKVDADKPPLADTLIYGSLANNSNQMKLRPGESADLVLEDSRHDFLKRALAQLGYPPSVKHIKFYLSQVIFEDGTMWSLGYWYQRDPANSENWIRISELGKRVGPRRDGPGGDRAELRNHAAAVEPQSAFRSLISSPQINPCQDPGFPFWQTCPGAASENCRRKVQPTSPSLFLRSHRNRPVLMPCKQCTFPTPGFMECDSVPHCSDVVLAQSFEPQLCTSITDEAECQLAGWFWNFTNSTCNEEPQSCAGHCAPYWPLESGACEFAVDYCGFQWGCGFGFTDGGAGCCCLPTPILIDVAGNGFALTDAYSGVSFDMGGDGHSEPIAWTKVGSDDAWLVLDRNGNGLIDSAQEMFGNFTPQPDTATVRNGFVALAEFDRREKGGNQDGRISNGDSVFGNLRLWQDTNQNGLSEAAELRTLSSLNITSLDLDFKASKKEDTNGNKFSYRAKVNDAHGNQLGRWAWDVTLSVNPPPLR